MPRGARPQPVSRGTYDGYRNAALLATLDLWMLRQASGIKLITVARALGVRDSTVSNWESGRCRPSGKPGAAYVRFIHGLARHAAVNCD